MNMAIASEKARVEKKGQISTVDKGYGSARIPKNNRMNSAQRDGDAEVRVSILIIRFYIATTADRKYFGQVFVSG